MVTVTVTFHEEQAAYQIHLPIKQPIRAVVQFVCFVVESVYRHAESLRKIVEDSSPFLR